MATAEFLPVQTPEELKETARLADEIWHECYASLLEKQQIDYMVDNLQSAAAIEEQVTQKGYEYYLVRCEGQAAGYLGIQPENGALLLSKVYLLNAWRGKGLVPQMFAFAENRAGALGCHTLWLTVNRHNDRAVAAYKKNGFTLVRQQVADIGGGFVMDDFVFEKKLAASV